MAGKQPTLSFARVVSGTVNSIGTSDNSTTTLSLNNLPNSSRQINGILSIDHSNTRDKSPGDKLKSTKGNIKKSDKKSNNSRSSRSRKALKAAYEKRLSIMSIEVEPSLKDTETANVTNTPIVLEPAPLPAVNAWFKSKGIFCIEI